MAKARQSGVNSLGLATLNKFCRLWALGVVPRSLELGSRLTKAEEYCLLGPVGPIEEVRLWTG